jgi:DsbC/DsbD-like thiol-disulfide interchange protein
MKKAFLSIAITLFAFVASAQMKNPVAWKFEARKKAAGEYEVIMTATVEKTWHLYSQNTGAGGPIPTKFTFKPNPLVVLSGKTAEKGKLEKNYDENFKTNVLHYANTVVFTQLVKLKNPTAKTSISGTVDFMACDDHECTAPKKQSFDIKLQ